jgi:hypothetical protein
MAEAKSVPVLFVEDPIVLPGMVVPVALDDAARAAVDAARATESGKLLRLAAQVGKKYGYYGAWQIAVVTTGLGGATSSKTVDSWGDPGPIYTEPTYGKATEATFIKSPGRQRICPLLVPFRYGFGTARNRPQSPG